MAKYERWTNERIHKKALKYKRPVDFKKGDIKAYNVAQQRGILDEVTSHMKRKKNVIHTDIEIVKIAQSFKTKADFREAHPTLRLVITRRGLEEDAYAHMVAKREYIKPDNDTIYIWEAVGITLDGKQVYKIGVTSFRRGIKRINEVSRKSAITSKIVEFTKTDHAIAIERELLTMGTDPKLTGFRGCTEFRAMSDDELEIAKEIISTWH